ncbi:MAG: adenylate cyclase [Novosphingobium sp.]|nr:adenylate cyclase [Novosphingobium sp.]
MTTAAIATSYPYTRDQRFFTRMAIGMAAFIVFGFAQWALRGFVSPATVPVWVHLHGVAMLSWLGLLIVQNLLAGGGNIALHRKLGWTGLALVLAIAGLGMFTGRMAVELHRVPPFFTNAFFLALTHVEAMTFALVVGAGIAMRRRTQWHRRLMLGATIIVMEPAFGRLVPAPILGPVLTPIIGLALQLGVLAIIARHDLRGNGTIHPATRVCAIVLIVMTATINALSVFPPFVSLAEGIAAGG